uniref:LOB domain-containing protein n=1 Tax=Physcomitrium patens TaxID=3218 RepID=A0A2K1KHA9_PHYPA|nr:hypothetical protein PHYPA_009533 [Physcomitrium patens]
MPVLVAKFFGRAGLMGFISAVSENERSALFQSLLYEACERTVNPVLGAMGLLWSGNWQICQAAVDTVLKGGLIRPPPRPNYTTPCFPALDMCGNSSIPSAEGVDDLTQITLSSNASVMSSLDTRTMSPGIGLPEANYQESKEFPSSIRDKANNSGQHLEAVVPQNAEPNFICQEHRQCDSWTQSKSDREFHKDELGHEFFELKKRTTGAFVASRRVRARVEASPPAPIRSGGGVHEDLLVPAHGDEQLELDLNLKVKGEKGGRLMGNTRLSSPCESVNSQGSVTSLDSALREPLKPLNGALGVQFLPSPYCTLLPLLQ